MNVSAAAWLRRIAIAAIMILAIGVAFFAVSGIDPWGDRGSGLNERFTLDLTAQKAIDPAMIRYVQTDVINVPLEEVRGIALGPQDRIYVAGDRAVQVYNSDGSRQATITVPGGPCCLAIGGAGHVHPGRLHVGIGDRIEVFDPAGEPVATWAGLGEKAILTSITLGKQDVFVADAGNRVVWRFDTDGKLLGHIGKRDPDRQMPGFVVPSPHFDVAVGGDGLVHVANPGARRIEARAFDGDLEGFWGEAGHQIDRFFGCCNPAHFTLLPDGRFVTSEKGIPRVKIYSSQGEFECVVAGPEQLGVSDATVGAPDQFVFDVAADSQGRVLVLDARASGVRIFQPKGGKPGAEL